MKETMVYMEWN